MGVCDFHYFDRLVRIDIPDEYLTEKISPEPVPPLADIAGEVLEATADPIGAPPLGSTLTPRSRVLIAVPDKSRHTDMREILHAVLKRIEAAGVHRDNITILIATGTHRPMTDEEIAAKFSPGIIGGYRVVNHVYDDMSSLIDLGTTKDGLPVQFNRLITEHDFIISIGAIKPHPVGGYSGGAKGLLPGIAGKRSTDYFHWEATKYPLFDIFGNPDNPVRFEMEDIVAKAGLSFIVNATENADGQISGVFAGDFVAAHRAGVAFLKETPLIAFPLTLPDILVVGLGKDRPDLWGGAAGIFLSAAFLKENGVLVLLAACPEGVARNHQVVLEHGYGNWRDVEKLVENGTIADRTGASHVVTIGKILEEKRMRVILVSESISPAEADRLGFIGMTDPQGAFDRALDETRGRDVLVYERI